MTKPGAEEHVTPCRECKGRKVVPMGIRSTSGTETCPTCKGTGVERYGKRRRTLNGARFLGYAIMIWCIVYSITKHAECKARGGQPVHSIFEATRCSK